MNKLILLFFICFIFTNYSFSQEGLPTNPKAGKCYIRCIVDDKWREKNVEITKVPGYKKLQIIPAEYKTIDVQVLMKPASKKIEIVPAVFKKVTDTLTTEEGYNKLAIVPTKFIDAIQDVLTQPAYSRFESKSSIEACKSKDPRDCEVLCYVEYPEQRIPFSIKKIDAVATTTKKGINSKVTTFTKEVMVSPATTKEIEIPAVYKTFKKKVLVRDETVKEIDVAPIFENQITKELEKAGGMMAWEEIDCKLTDYNPLPIYYNLNSAQLTPKAKEIINQKIYNLMAEKSRIRVEISSHTDSRNSDKYNMNLSQRRAQSVVDYLVSKGIKKSRLVAKGYGESHLKEPCPDGVPCTEDQHAKNRRTEFRVLTN